MKWWKRKNVEAQREERPPLWSLQEAVEQAKRDWQNAHHYINGSERDVQIDNGIYYLKLTEKRYMFLLQQARRERGM
ncbi:UNVERIFIED_CONTAM: hypothetical protein ABID98_003845 [Brevibacillus sp. OAP136]